MILPPVNNHPLVSTPSDAMTLASVNRIQFSFIICNLIVYPRRWYVNNKMKFVLQV